MKKGLKKFLAMVSIMGLTSGVGALKSFADVNDISGKQPFIAAKYTTYYQLKDGKNFDNYKEYFDVVKIDGKDFYKQKPDLKGDILNKANDSLADFTAYYFGTDLNENVVKKGLSNVTVAGFAVGSALASAGAAIAIEELVVHADKSCE